MGWGRTDPHVWEHHVLAWAWLESPPGVAMAVSQASRTERRGGGGAAQGAHSDLAHWPPCPEGGLAGRLPQAAPIEAPSSPAPEPMDQVPEGPRTGAGTRPECLPAAVLPRTPADQCECPRAAHTAPPRPHACPPAWGPQCGALTSPTAQCCEQRCPLLGCGQRTARVSKCPQLASRH